MEGQTLLVDDGWPLDEVVLHQAGPQQRSLSIVQVLLSCVLDCVRCCSAHDALRAVKKLSMTLPTAGKLEHCTSAPRLHAQLCQVQQRIERTSSCQNTMHDFAYSREASALSKYSLPACSSVSDTAAYTVP